MVRGTVVASVDARVEVIPDVAPPAAQVDVELNGQVFTLPAQVARALLERLANSVIAAELYSHREEYRQTLQRRQAERVIGRRTRGEPA